MEMYKPCEEEGERHLTEEELKKVGPEGICPICGERLQFHDPDLDQTSYMSLGFSCPSCDSGGSLYYLPTKGYIRDGREDKKADLDQKIDRLTDELGELRQERDGL